MRIRLLTLGFLLLASFPLIAQVARDAVTVEIVDVPVFVTRGSVPVGGLTRDDFELYVNGKRQVIEYFDDTSRPAADYSPDLRDRRLFLVLLDLTFSPPHFLGRMQRAAGELIARSPDGDVFAVATISSRRGVTFATPFTRDRIALARAIGSLSATRSGDPLSLVMSSSEREMMTALAADRPERSEALFRDTTAGRMSGEALRDIWATQVFRAAEDQVVEFKELGRRLAGLSGQKHVVLLSDGFDSGERYRPTDAARTAREASFNYDNGFTTGSGLWLGGGSSRLMRGMDEMHEAFQTGDILLHAVEVRGLDSLMGSDALHALATGTGGRYVPGRNDLGGALSSLAGSLDHVYRLGFQPRMARAGQNTIRVKVRGLPRGTTVRHRQGFSGSAAPLDARDGLYLADVLLNDVPQSGTAVTLQLQQGTLDVTIPIGEIAAQLGPGKKAELLLYAFDARGSAIFFQRQLIEIPENASGTSSLEVALPDGAVVAKALLGVGSSLGFSRAAL